MSEVRRLESRRLPPKLPLEHEVASAAMAGSTPVREVETSTAAAYREHQAGVERMRASLAVVPPTTPPATQVERFEAYFSAFTEGAEIALDAITRDGYADWVDTFGNTNRARPADVADAALRMSAALHSVVDDLRSGRLAPLDLGARTYAEIDPAEILDLAKSRVSSSDFDLTAATGRMQLDPVWTADPIMLPTPKGMQPLDETRTGNVMIRGIPSAVAPAWMARHLLDTKLGRTIAAGAKAVADAPTQQRARTAKEANLATAYALYQGHGTARNAHAALPAIVALANVSPIRDLAKAPQGATKATLTRHVEDGEIDGYIATSDGFVTYHLKTSQEVAEEVNAKLEMGMLDHLGIDARVQLGVMLGPDGAPGQELADRLESEGRSSAYRQVASAVIELAAVSAVSGGMGAIAEGVAVGARMSSTGIRIARFVASSASFTTMLGLKSGDLSAKAYVKDGVMFGVLAKVAKLVPVAKAASGATLPARLRTLAKSYGVSVSTTAGVLTGAQLLERYAKGDARWEQVGTDLVHNLAVVGILHATTSALHTLRPQLAPGSIARAELETLNARHKRFVEKTKVALDAADRAVAADNLPAARRAVKALASVKADAAANETALRKFAYRTIGTKAGREVDRDIARARERIEGESAVLERVDAKHQERLKEFYARDTMLGHFRNRAFKDRPEIQAFVDKLVQDYDYNAARVRTAIEEARPANTRNPIMGIEVLKERSDADAWVARAKAERDPVRNPEALAGTAPVVRSDATPPSGANTKVLAADRQRAKDFLDPNENLTGKSASYIRTKQTVLTGRGDDARAAKARLQEIAAGEGRSPRITSQELSTIDRRIEKRAATRGIGAAMRTGAERNETLRTAWQKTLETGELSADIMRYRVGLEAEGATVYVGKDGAMRVLRNPQGLAAIRRHITERTTTRDDFRAAASDTRHPLRRVFAEEQLKVKGDPLVNRRHGELDELATLTTAGDYRMARGKPAEALVAAQRKRAGGYTDGEIRIGHEVRTGKAKEPASADQPRAEIRTDIDVETPNEVIQVKSGVGSTDHVISSPTQAYETIKYATAQRPPKKVTFVINAAAEQRVLELRKNIRTAIDKLATEGHRVAVEVNVELADFTRLDI